MRILDGIGQEIDIDLVETQLIAVEMLMIEMIDAEAEIDVLLFHHRLGNIHQILRAFYNGKGGRAQIQLTAFNLGNIQNIVDQGQQMIAGETDFMQVFLDGGAVLRVLFRNGSQADNSVHGRADVMGHSGEEVRLCLARPISGSCRILGAIIGPQQHGQIENEQKKKPCGYNSYQRPVRVPWHQRLQWHHGDHNPIVRGVDPCMRHQTAFLLRKVHLEAAGCSREILRQLVPGGVAAFIVVLIKLKKIGTLEGVSADDIITGGIDQGNFGVFVVVRGERPFCFERGFGDDSQENSISWRAILRAFQGDLLTKGDRTPAADGIIKGTGHINCFASAEKSRYAIGEQINIPIIHRQIVRRKVRILRYSRQSFACQFVPFRKEHMRHKALISNG